jgi:hypothetical protein
MMIIEDLQYSCCYGDGIKIPWIQHQDQNDNNGNNQIINDDEIIETMIMNSAEYAIIR